MCVLVCLCIRLFVLRVHLRMCLRPCLFCLLAYVYTCECVFSTYKFMCLLAGVRVSVRLFVYTSACEYDLSVHIPVRVCILACESLFVCLRVQQSALFTLGE